jgi:HEAT repeat protein
VAPTATPGRVVDDDALRAVTGAPIGPSRRGWVVAFGVLGLLAAGGAAGYWYLNQGAVTEPASTGPAQPLVTIPPPPAPPPPLPKPEVAITKARAILMDHMKSESPRVQRVAAEALSRTGDREAIELLADLLKKPPKDATEAARFDAAYALARAGDKRGTEALAAGLRVTSRTDRGIAAEKLAKLGDPQSVKPLKNSLDISQLKLGAAVSLAPMAEPHALKVLDQVRADPKASRDDRARATIGLGMAGRQDVAPELRELLEHDRFNTDAAMALVQLKDQAAKPILQAQLAIPSLRVGAARAMRRLEPSIDVRPLLPPLLDALATGRDTEQVAVGEAILLLAGDPDWSRFP